MNRKNRSSSTFSNYAKASVNFAAKGSKPWDERQRELQDCLSSKDPHQPALSVDALLDALQAVYLDSKTYFVNSSASSLGSSKVLNTSTGSSSSNSSSNAASANNLQQGLGKFVKRYERVLNRIQSLRLNLNDFELIKPLAKGAFATVCLVRHLADRKLYALKILKKKMLQETREAAYFMEERNALVYASNSRWITSLFASFQDENNLYLVMEYAPGGSLRSMTTARDYTLTENEARFYVAEIILALQELHNLKFVHRDVKPENCLITSDGHVKLADFGSCIRMDDKDMTTSLDAVGTPDYIPPEVLRAHEGKMSYGKECDWWSLGVILYELLHGETPFCADSIPQVYSKIMNHRDSLKFGEDLKLSDELKDLLSKLLTDKEQRLGRNGIEEIKNHAWFNSINWDSVELMTPPFIPNLKSEIDTTYFEDEDVGDFKPPNTKQTIKSEKPFNGSHMPFVGYSFHSRVKPVVELVGVLQTAVPTADLEESKNILLNSAASAAAHSSLTEASEQAGKASADDRLVTPSGGDSAVVEVKGESDTTQPKQVQKDAAHPSIITTLHPEGLFGGLAAANVKLSTLNHLDSALSSGMPQSPFSAQDYFQKKSLIKSLQQKLLLAQDLKELSQSQLYTALTKVESLSSQLEAAQKRIDSLEIELQASKLEGVGGVKIPG